MATCGWDGVVKVWRFNRHQNLSLQWQMKLGHASTCLACLHSTADEGRSRIRQGSIKLVSGHFDGTVATIQIGGGGEDAQSRTTSLHSKLQKAARSLTTQPSVDSSILFTRKESDELFAAIDKVNTFLSDYDSN